MSSYKLVYFQARGSAEISRLVFAAAGKEYEDVRISTDDWKDKKPDQPLKALPVLELDGKKYCQGAAIARYLAKEFGLMGKNNLEAFRIEEIQDAFADLMQQFAKVHFETDEAKKAELQKTTGTETLPKFLTFLEMRLCENEGGDGFVVGKTLTLGDLCLYLTVDVIKQFAAKMQSTDPMAKFPKLSAHYSRIVALPKIADWLKKRPVTEF